MVRKGAACALINIDTVRAREGEVVSIHTIRVRDGEMWKSVADN
jgi:hypothetical protein